MKILKLIYSIFVGFIAVVALLLIISVLPITGNFKTMTVISGSMEPVIKVGSVVVVKPQNDYKIGDIVTFGKTKIPTSHRIYDIKVDAGQPVFITKGDANNAPDTTEIKKADIMGRVLFSVPYAGYAVEFAKKPMGFALIIIVPALLIIADEARKIYEQIKKKRSEKEKIA